MGFQLPAKVGVDTYGGLQLVSRQMQSHRHHGHHHHGTQMPADCHGLK